LGGGDKGRFKPWEGKNAIKNLIRKNLAKPKINNPGREGTSKRKKTGKKNLIPASKLARGKIKEKPATDRSY